MSPTKTIAIIGATGNQGNSVAKTFLGLSTWKVRAITRNTESEKAQQLKSLGAEAVQANLEDVDSLARAFEGVHAIFVNTDFWEPYRGFIASGVALEAASKKTFDIEVLHAKNAAIAATKVPTLEVYVYSALGPMSEVSGGKYNHSNHWETKAAVVKYIESELPELAKKFSTIYIGAYNTNAFLYPKKNEATGRYQVIMPASKETKLPIIDVLQSTGVFVRALVEDEEPGTKLVAYDSYHSIEEAMDIWTRVTGQEADFIELELEEMNRITGVPLEILDGAAYLGRYNYTDGIKNVIEPHQLKTKVQRPSYGDFLKKQGKHVLLNGDVQNK